MKVKVDKGMVDIAITGLPMRGKRIIVAVKQNNEIIGYEQILNPITKKGKVIF